MNQMPILGFPWSRHFCWEGFFPTLAMGPRWLVNMDAFTLVVLGYGGKTSTQMYQGIISQSGWWFQAFFIFTPTGTFQMG